MTSSPITKLLALLVLVLGLLTAPVAADIAINKYDHHQYMSQAHEEIYVCSCASTAQYYEVVNEGDFAANFQFSMQAEMDWVTLHTHSAYLQPGESATISVTISPPCGLEMDPPYKIFSSSQYGRFQVAETHVTATVCESLSFQLEQHDNNIQPCTPADFDLHVKNVAPHKETYTLTSDDPDNVQLARQEVTLQPGERTTVPATAQYSCDVSGDVPIAFSAYAQNTQSTHTRDAVLTILDDYEYLLQEVDTQQDAFCQEVSNTKELRLTNIADTPNTYRLSHRGPGFASLSEELVVLQPGHSKTVQLQLAADAPSGEHTSTVTAVSEYGDNRKTVDVSYSTRSCYDAQITVSPSQQTVCAGEAEFNVRIENRGESTETYTLTPEGDIFSQVSTSQVSLRPAEHAEVVLTASVPDRDQEHTIDLHVHQTPGIERVVHIPVTGVSNAACTQVATSEEKLTLYRDETVWPVILTNDGIRASNYQLSLESEAVSLREEEVFLAPGEQAVLHLEAKDLESLADGQYVAELLAVSERSEYRRDFHLTVKDKGFFSQLYEQVAYGREGYTNWCLFFVVLLAAAALLLLLLLAFSGGWQVEQGLARTLQGLLALAAVVFLIAAIATAATTSIPAEVVDEPRGSSYADLYHEFEQNTRYDLDLSRYFIDPDGDPLRYTHSQPENLHIQVEDDVARITPDRGYSGEQSVVFTAIDSAGASVDSPIMTIRVLGVAPTTAWQWISAYCTPVNFGLLMLIALLLIGLLARTRQPDTTSDSALAAYAAGTPRTGTGASRAELVDAQQPPSPTAGTQVGGDVVAGDKVTYAGGAKPQILVASKGGKKAHRRTCTTVERIKKDKRVTFANEKEAIEAGYSGCKLCQSFSD